jgi:hypothetical protein
LIGSPAASDQGQQAEGDDRQVEAAQAQGEGPDRQADRRRLAPRE